MKSITFFILLFALYPFILLAQSDLVNQYSVCWNSASGNASGAMPIGNGEVGANVWVEDTGDLVFYISRTDAWSENSSLYKLGRIRVSFSSSILGQSTSFKQFLNLKEGKIEINAESKGKKIALDFFVDAETPVIYLTGKSNFPVGVTVTSEIWRNDTRILPVQERHFALGGCPSDSLAVEYPDVVCDTNKDLIVYHRNEHSIYPFTLIHQGLSDGNFEKDPLINRTMGYRISGINFSKVSPVKMSTRTDVNQFCLKIAALTNQTKDVNDWLSLSEKIVKQAPSFHKANKRTALWWKRYWDRSYVVVKTPDDSTGYKITQTYLLQNWMTACAGRGNYPIKFNGSIFTVEPCYTDEKRPYSPDFRLWGPDYWWQNTRLIYHPMLKTGDFEMMEVLFKHFSSNLPMMKKNAEVFWKAKGAVNPETSTIFGTFVNSDYGWKRDGIQQGETVNPYVRYYWSSGLELVALMCDYYQYTLDEKFANEQLLPMAFEILTFYNTFFQKDKTGILQITPTHSLETYWENVKNDQPNVAGLHYVIKSLLNMSAKFGTLEDRTLWNEVYQALPKIPTEENDNRLVFAPAETYDKKQTNIENPELYTIFPFPLCNLSTPDKQVGIHSFNMRAFKGEYGWTQDGQQAVRLGLKDEAVKNMLAKLKYRNLNHRFPVIWGPNYDWTPDQDHGSNFMLMLQEMVMQSYGDTVYVLPAFPADWDVSFKLYLPGRNLISGERECGKWKTKPSCSYNNSKGQTLPFINYN